MNLIKCDANDYQRITDFYILCVNPHMQRQALAENIMYEIIQVARNMGMKAIRLNALCCNKPAHKLYEKCGFIKRGIQNWYAENTGWIDFYLYELVLSQLGRLPLL